MAEHSAIEWTDATWNPIRARNLATGKLGWHCTHASEGCRNCYAEGFNRRLGTGVAFQPQRLGRDIEVFLDETMLAAPLRWRKPRRIFVGSMSDLFGEFVPDAWIDRIFAVMALAPQHTFQVLTKRSARMQAYATDHFGRLADVIMAMRASDLGARFNVGPNALGPLPHLRPAQRWWPLANVQLGVSTEDQARADERIPDLLATPAAIRFLSAEPLLGPIDLTQLYGRGWSSTQRWDALRGTGNPSLMGVRGMPRGAHLDWVIAGGESGPGARPMHPDWARQLRDACAAAGVPFFFKQWGEWLPAVEDDDGARLYCVADDGGDEDRLAGFPVRPVDRRTFHDRTMWRVGKRAAGRLLDGREHDALPEPRHG